MAKQGRIFAVIFLALLIPVLLAAPESEAKVYRGKYANNTKWSYDTKTKTVIIECRGELPDDHHGSAEKRAGTAFLRAIWMYRSKPERWSAGRRIHPRNHPFTGCCRE